MQINTSETKQENKDCWATPDNIVKGILEYFKKKCILPANSEYGLDVCASAHNFKCEPYFTELDDALIQAWGKACNGVAWCNPPYSRGMKEGFIKKAIEHSSELSTIMLLPNDTSTKWFMECVKYATAIVFMCGGRVDFVDNETGVKTKGSSFGNIFALFSPYKTELKTFYVTKAMLERLGGK